VARRSQSSPSIGGGRLRPNGRNFLRNDEVSTQSLSLLSSTNEDEEPQSLRQSSGAAGCMGGTDATTFTLGGATTAATLGPGPFDLHTRRRHRRVSLNRTVRPPRTGGNTRNPRPLVVSDPKIGDLSACHREIDLRRFRCRAVSSPRAGTWATTAWSTTST
jgi:hypothetical protein